MHTLANRSLWAAPRYTTFKACRVVAGRRFPLPTRHFRSLTNPLKQSHDDSTDTGEPTWTHIRGTTETPDNEVPHENEGATEVEDAGKGTEDSLEASAKKVTKLKDKSNYGSAAARAGRNIKRSKETPQITIPTWFAERNVLLHQDLSRDDGRLSVYQNPTNTTSHLSFNPGVSRDPALESEMPNGSTTDKPIIDDVAGFNSYEIDGDIYAEISATVSSGLCPSSSRYANSYPALKPHIILQSPKDGGIFFLDAVVKSLAVEHKADMIQVDAQDIAEIAGEVLGDVADANSKSLRSLGYDTHLMMARQEQHDVEEDGEEEEEDVEDMEDDQTNSSRSRQQGFGSTVPIIRSPILTYVGSIKEIFAGKAMEDLSRFGVPRMPNQQSSMIAPLGQSAAVSEDNKASSLIEALLDTAQNKSAEGSKRLQDGTSDRQETSNTAQSEPLTAIRNEDDPSPSTSSEKSLIVMIKDYVEINATLHGRKVLNKLHEVLRERRKNGQRILLMGTTSSQDLIPSMSKSGFRSLQNETSSSSPTKTIITPCRGIMSDSTFAADEKFRIKQINLRHIQDMLRRLSPSKQLVNTLVSQRELELDSAQVFASGLDEGVWHFELVHRTATVALGLVGDSEELTLEHLARSLAVLTSSEDAKFDWLAEEKYQGTKRNEPIRKTSHASDVKKENDDRIRKLRKTCNTHEKKLLSGVVDAASITTTFADVQAPLETIEALKTLTSLSLIRPEAFTYGVLASDKIPGLLLYGPPGTGKTLLAKAVAKESGATVLEISGSDVYDMYVGEGEKNVRAIFTLAKKLSPCVVFIDEADAIFGSRGTSANRVSHRELINQFLREWDGMNNLSTFIMVATNRPFDLDDAVLRRLPRRLLVDLPTEKDRQAILTIHLKDESLDPSVSLWTLASQTPFYSGSDLKNLAVAAALACVREENDNARNAATQIGADASESYKYPEKRTLAPRHFEKAMQEISASVSEDMGSLGAIRKFDERYGDRRGRRKKGGYGFGTQGEGDKEREDVVRVRSQEKGV